MQGIIEKEQIEYLDRLRTEPDELLKEMEKYARENFVPIINWSAAEFLEQMITIHKPENVLELGTAIGYSAIRVARVLKENAHLDTIELCEASVKMATRNITKADLQNKITVHYGNAHKILPTIKKEYEFIFLDADKKDYIELFKLSISKLKKGGVIFVDNLLWKGRVAQNDTEKRYKASTACVKEFNPLFIAEETLNSSIFPVGDGVGIGIKIK